jgi:putative nucleotidyltransferase with HDIG domain
VDVRDHLAPGHAQLVGRYAELIAREFSFPDSDVRLIRLAGVLHDVGKFIVPRTVFQKPGPLDEIEWEIVRQHPEAGARLLEEAELDDIASWVHDHHEQPDGNGYPRGLKAGEISLEARVLAVADAYEAMTTERSHRPALSHAVAREELTTCAGTQFDRRVVQAFLRQLERQCLVRVESSS